MANNENGATLGQPQGVHLVGSVPLQDAEEVFRVSCATLDSRCVASPTVRPGFVATGSDGR